MTTDARTLVRSVLSQLGTSRAARHYLKQYSQGEQHQFAVIKVGGAVVRDSLEPLAAALAFLRNLGLMPIILHGAGPQLDQALSEAGIATEKRDGLRVTSAKVMEVARPVFYKTNRRLVSALEDQGVRAQGIQHGVFQCDFLDENNLGLVGDIKSIDLDAISEVVDRGILPVVTSLGENSTGQVLNINADIAARELVWKVKPSKIIFISDQGGLLNESGRIISAISLRTDLDFLLQQDWVHSGMRLKLEEISRLLTKLPESASVSITSVNNLARELFTHRGAGTLIRVGENIIETPNLGSAEDTSKTIALLEESFSQTLIPGYFDDTRFECVIKSESFGAAAIVEQGIDNIPYLNKFAVTPLAQGVGLGNAVWQALRKRCPSLYWRSRTDNPITPWYFEQAESSFTKDSWVVFTIGISDPTTLHQCYDDAFKRPSCWREGAS